MTISNHPHPNALLRRLVAILVGLGLAGVLIGSIGLIFLGLSGLILMFVAVPFLMGLGIPLLLATSLHPAIAVEETGVRLKPLLFRARLVRWEEIEAIIDHTLLTPAPPSKFRRQPQRGEMFRVQAGVLPFQYRVVGLMAGYGLKPIFAISSRTHIDYEALRRYIQEHV